MVVKTYRKRCSEYFKYFIAIPGFLTLWHHVRPLIFYWKQSQIKVVTNGGRGSQGSRYHHTATNSCLILLTIMFSPIRFVFLSLCHTTYHLGSLSPTILSDFCQTTIISTKILPYRYDIAKNAPIAAISHLVVFISTWHFLAIFNVFYLTDRWKVNIWGIFLKLLPH